MKQYYLPKNGNIVFATEKHRINVIHFKNIKLCTLNKLFFFLFQIIKSLLHKNTKEQIDFIIRKRLVDNFNIQL